MNVEPLRPGRIPSRAISQGTSARTADLRQTASPSSGTGRPCFESQGCRAPRTPPTPRRKTVGGAFLTTARAAAGFSSVTRLKGGFIALFPFSRRMCARTERLPAPSATGDCGMGEESRGQSGFPGRLHVGAVFAPGTGSPTTTVFVLPVRIPAVFRWGLSSADYDDQRTAPAILIQPFCVLHGQPDAAVGSGAPQRVHRAGAQAFLIL